MKNNILALISFMLFLLLSACNTDNESGIENSGPLENNNPIKKSIKDAKPLPMPTIDQNQLPPPDVNGIPAEPDEKTMQGAPASNQN